MPKRVLLLRARKKTDTSSVPHLGLAMLSAVLRKKGHDVMVVDHLLFDGYKKPSVTELLDQFDPDVIGFSLYTATMSVSNRLIGEVYDVSRAPVIVGGPHATLYSSDLAKDKRISYVMKGEAESSIVEVVENAKKQKEPVVIDCSSPDLSNLPMPDFTTFLNYDRIIEYPLQTSRGCPYGCKFCAVRLLSTRKWRKRDYKTCVDEIEKARKLLPNLKSVKIVDDSPTVDLERFKKFLQEYIDRRIGLPMNIDNLRADSIDEEFVSLAKKAGCTSICLGAESGNPVVFESVGKMESLDEIRNAANFINRAGLRLGLCFVIGLPHDTYERTKDSIALAKELKPSLIFWNMAHPMEGTEMRKWFKQNNAKIYDDTDYASYERHTLGCRDPIVETEDFNLEDRKKAHFMAVVETDQYRFTIDEIRLLITYGIRYRLYFAAFRSLLRKLGSLLRGKIRLLVNTLRGR